MINVRGRQQRLRRLAEFLRRTPGRMSSGDLAEQLGVSKRTIERDLAALRDSGVHLHSTVGRRGGVRVVRSESDSDAAAAEAARIDGNPFVGRNSELTQLDEALRGALGGTGNVVVVSGEPGIGKTRLAEEFTVIARSQDAEVCWGRSSEDSAAPPYWPWIQILREICAKAPDEELRRFAGEANSGLGLLVPYFREILPAAWEDVPWAPERARFELFDAVALFLRRYSEPTPLVLVFDDVHVADSSTISLIAFLAERIADTRICVLATHRTSPAEQTEALNDLLASLGRIGHVRNIELGSLSLDASSDYLSAALGTMPDTKLLRTLTDTTEGNPLYLSEISRLIAAMDRAPGARELILPDTLRATISRRLSHLSVVSNQILSTAALIGREFDVRVLVRILDDSIGQDVAMALDEAARHDLINGEGDGHSYRFRHSLIGWCAAEQVSETDARRIHREIANTFERFYRDELEHHLDEIAFHHLAAGAESDSRVTAEYCLRAGEQAYSRHAFKDARDHFQNGLEQRRPHPSDRLTADLLRNLGRSQLQTSEIHELATAVETLTRAFEIYLELGMTRLALDTASIYINAMPGVPLSTELLTRAIELAPRDSKELAELFCRYGLAAAMGQGDLSGGTQALSEALEMAQRIGDELVESRALGFMAYVRAVWLQPDRSEALGSQALEIVRSSHDLMAEINALNARSINELCRGNVRGAYELTLQQLGAAESAHNGVHISSCLWTLSRFCRDLGLWNQFRDYNDRALEMRARYPTALADRAVVEHWLGEDRESERYLQRLLDETNEKGEGNFAGFGPQISRTEALAHIGTLTDDEQMLALARDALRELPAQESAPPFHRLAGMQAVAMIAGHDGDSDTLRHLYAEVRRIGLDNVPMVMQGLAANLAWEAGDEADAERMFKNAQEALTAGGGRMFQVFMPLGYSARLIARGRAEDIALARRLIGTGLTVSAEIGMVRHHAILENLLARADSLARGGRHAPWSLTKRELEVLQLIDSGQTNRAISKELVISEHTVLRHVSNILSKTSAENRTEAASKARAIGLFGRSSVEAP